MKQHGLKRTGKYKYLLDYTGREDDLKVLGMQEYPERLERYTKALAGDKSRYTNATVQMQADAQYINNNNGKYNHFTTTQKNLTTLGAWGEKRPYYQMQSGELGKNVLRGMGNVGTFVRNYTLAPIYGTIGKHVVAPIHRKFARADEGSMYRNRPLHRYEARKEYFARQGSNFLMARIKAITNFREANEKIVQNRISQIQSAEAEATIHTTYTQGYEQEIKRLREKNRVLEHTKPLEKYKKWEKIDKKIERNQEEIERYEKALDSILRTKDVLGGEAISQLAHERASKEKITGATTIANMAVAFGVKKLINHAMKPKEQPEIPTEITNDEDIITIYEQSGKPYPDGKTPSVPSTDIELSVPNTGKTSVVPDTGKTPGVDSVQIRQQQIRQLTLGDYMTLAEGQQEVPLQYAVNYGRQKSFPVDAIKYPRGLTIETKKGILSMADGNGFDINGYANFLTGRQLNLEDNLWDTLAELLNKSGSNVTGESLCERFAKLSPEQQINFLSKVDITVGNKTQGIPLGHLDGAKSSVTKMIEDMEFGG